MSSKEHPNKRSVDWTVDLERILRITAWEGEITDSHTIDYWRILTLGIDY